MTPTEPDILRLDPTGLPDARRLGYAQITVAPEGVGLIFVSGQTGESAEGTRMPGFGAQVAQAFANLDHALTCAGSSRARVLKITLLVVDHDDRRMFTLVQANKAFFGDTRPASTLIPVPRLASDWMQFEIEAVAALTPA